MFTGQSRGEKKVKRDYSYLLLSTSGFLSVASTLVSSKILTKYLSVATFILTVVYYNYQQKEKCKEIRDKLSEYRELFYVVKRYNDRISRVIELEDITYDEAIEKSPTFAMTFSFPYINFVMQCELEALILVSSLVMLSLPFFILIPGMSSATPLCILVAFFIRDIHISHEQAYDNKKILNEIIIPLIQRSTETTVLFTWIQSCNFSIIGLLIGDTLALLFSALNHFHFSYKLNLARYNIDNEIKRLENIKSQQEEKQQSEREHATQQQPREKPIHIIDQLSEYTAHTTQSIVAFFGSPDNVEPEQPNLWRDWLPQW